MINSQCAERFQVRRVLLLVSCSFAWWLRNPISQKRCLESDLQLKTANDDDDASYTLFNESPCFLGCAKINHSHNLGDMMGLCVLLSWSHHHHRRLRRNSLLNLEVSSSSSDVKEDDGERKWCIKSGELSPILSSAPPANF